MIPSGSNKLTRCALLGQPDGRRRSVDAGPSYRDFRAHIC